MVDQGRAVTVSARTQRTPVGCPACGELTGRVLTRADGSHYDLPPEAYRQEPVSEITEEPIRLREPTVAAGREPWYGLDFTAHRDGRFDLRFSYDPSEWL